MSKILSTIGLLATGASLNKPTMCKVWFEKLDDDLNVKCWVENARNGNLIKSLGYKTITRQQLRDMPDDAYDNVVFAKAAFSLFSLSI